MISLCQVLDLKIVNNFFKNLSIIIANFVYFFKELPTAEIFTFMFNTGLTELAYIFPTYRSKIINVQYKIISDLIKALSNSSAFSINNIDIVKTITTSSLVEKIDSTKACRVLIPILIGLLRSIGR